MQWLGFEKDTPTEDVFTVDFNSKAGARTPTIEIGKINRQKAAGNLGHVPVNSSSGSWIVDNISFEVNGVVIDHKQSMVFGRFSDTKWLYFSIDVSYRHRRIRCRYCGSAGSASVLRSSCAYRCEFPDQER